VSEVDGKTYPVAWINRYGKARVFGTTYGHSDEMFSDPVFLEYVSRGLLWSAGRLPE
jgi:type 1 glutamine amidotransferase